MTLDTADKKEQKKKLKVAIYFRVSSHEQVDQYWIEVQKAKVENRLKYNTDDYIFAGDSYSYNESDETGVSGRKEFNTRQQGKKMLQDLETASILWKEPPFDVVLVYKLDRLARRVKVLYDIITELEQYGVSIASSTENFDAKTPFGRAVIGILWVFAELERENFMERSSAWKEQMKIAGEIQSEFYGYEKDSANKPLIVRKEAMTIKDIFHKFALEDCSIKKICDDLMQEAIPIPSYSALKKWLVATEKKAKKAVKLESRSTWKFNRTDKTIRGILQDDRYAGRYYYNKTKVNEKTGKSEVLPKSDWKLSPAWFPVIVVPEIFDKAQQKLNRWRKTKSIDNTQYLLSGLLRCDFCYKHRSKVEMCTWQWKPSSGGWEEIYQCYGKRSDRNKVEKRCTCQPLNRKDLDKLVVFHIVQLLKNPKSLKRIVEEMTLLWETQASLLKKEAELKQERDKVKQQEEKLEHAFYTESDDHLTQEAYKEYREELEDKVSSIEEKLITIAKKLQYTIDTESYFRALKVIHEKISTGKELLSSSQSIRNLLQYVVKRIVIYSKTVESNKWLPWKRGAVLPATPYKIQIELKLPQEYIDSFFDGYDPTPFSPWGDDPKDPDSGQDSPKSSPWAKNKRSKSVALRKESSKTHTKVSNAPLLIRFLERGIFFVFGKPYPLLQNDQRMDILHFVSIWWCLCWVSSER